ncbi:MAG: YlbF family regulator [Verrucomicrobia bacterium]|nr:YlbF family regulator [Verrucomicrobiota bacterium]MDE3098238.1 YlbF family regulator [Verrucomicrobiota bacterium]
MPTKIEEKTQELCAAIVAQPEMASIRSRIDAFLGDSGARDQYESLMKKGRVLQEKQQQGRDLDGLEIAEFERHRDTLLQNPVARGFLDAQQELHEMEHSIRKYVARTFELGRVPTESDMAESSCGHGCGCHH